jgi:hypothetical protein
VFYNSCQKNIKTKQCSHLFFFFFSFLKIREAQLVYKVSNDFNLKLRFLRFILILRDMIFSHDALLVVRLASFFGVAEFFLCYVLLFNKLVI